MKRCVRWQRQKDVRISHSCYLQGKLLMMCEGYLIGDDGETSLRRLKGLPYRCDDATLLRTGSEKSVTAEPFFKVSFSMFCGECSQVSGV